MPRQAKHSPQQALALLSRGLSVREVSQALECHRDTVYGLLATARRLELLSGPPRTLVPSFPCDAYTPRSRCNCEAFPIALGSCRVCGVCWRSAWDWHPRLQATPLPPEPKTSFEPDELKGGTEEAAKPKPGAPLTRKQRRAILFAKAESAKVNAVLLQFERSRAVQGGLRGGVG